MLLIFILFFQKFEAGEEERNIVPCPEEKNFSFTLSFHISVSGHSFLIIS